MDIIFLGTYHDIPRDMQATLTDPGLFLLQLFGFVAQIFITIAIANSDNGFSASWTVPRALMFTWVSVYLTFIAVGLGKVSAVAFILSLQGPTHQKMRYFLHFIAYSNVSHDHYPRPVSLANHLERRWSPISLSSSTLYSAAHRPATSGPSTIQLNATQTSNRVKTLVIS